MSEKATTQNAALKYDLHDKPPVPQWIVLAIQHVFAMFGATILVPILVNAQAGEEVLTIPVTLVCAGIGTLIYIVCTKAGSPVFLGSSFAFIAPVAAAYTRGGKGGAFTGIMVVGIIYIIVALIVKLVGKRWIDRVLPPVVIGPMIMIIGLGLASSAVGQIGIASGTDIDWKGVIVALATFVITALVMVLAKGFLKIIPFLIGIIGGYIVAVLLGLVDFTPVLEAGFFSIPHFQFPGVTYTPNLGVALTIAPIAIVTMAEHIGDHTALGAIIGKDLLHKPGLDRTLLGDGLATFVAGLLGGPANTTYGENTSVVGMTRVASVWVTGTAGIFAIILGFLGKFTALVQTIPNPVLGGVSLLLYGFIAVNGLKVLIQNQTNFNKNKNIIVASTMLVLGLGGAALTFGTGNVSLTFSGMSLAAIVGVVLNLFLPEEREPIIEEIGYEEEEDAQGGADDDGDSAEGGDEEVEIPFTAGDARDLPNVFEMNHPIITHKLRVLRDKKTGTKEFREVVEEVCVYMCYRALEDAELNEVEIETPITKMVTGELDENRYAFVPILRAGMGMLGGLTQVIPNAKIGHIGMYRDEKNGNKPVNYFFKVPSDIEHRTVILLDPMLATGGSAVDAIDMLKEKGVKSIKFLCVIAAPEGLKVVTEAHPDVPIYCGAIDDHLNEKAYIVPGLGDAGDRIYGTK